MSEVRQETKLKRTLGFWLLMGIAVAQIIGAGIMSQTGIAIAMTGTGVVLAFLISSVLTLVTIMPDAIMGGALPVTGGKYRYISRLLGKKVGFVYLGLYLVSSLSITFYGLSFSSYVVSLAPNVNTYLIAIVVLTFFYIINLYGVELAAKVNTITCIAQLAGIALFIAYGFGLGKVDFGYIFDTKNMFTGGLTGFLGATALLSFASGGAQVICEMGGEIINPGKNIPRVIISSTLSIGFLYVFMSSVAVGVLPIEVTANQPLTLVANEVLPSWGFYFFIIFVALATIADTLNSQYSWVTRPILVACDDGMLPKSLGTVNKHGVPWKILTVFYALAVVPIILKLDLSFISRLSTAISLITKILVALACYMVPKKYGKQLAEGYMSVKPGTVKVLSVSAIILSIILSASLVAALPAYVPFAIAGIIIVCALYASVGLKNVDIEDDLAIDFTTADAEAEE